MKARFLFLFLLSFLMVLTGCEQAILNYSDYSGGGGKIPTKDIDVDIHLPDVLKPKISDLELMGFTGKQKLDLSLKSKLEVIQNEKPNLLMVRDKSNKLPVMLGIVEANSNKVSVSDTSTALGLTMLNPFLVMTKNLDRADFLNRVKQSAKFDELLGLVKNGYETNKEKLFDYQTNPQIFQKSVELVKGVLKGILEPGEFKNLNFDDDPPKIEDLAGNDFKIVNNNLVWYAAGIYKNGVLQDVYSVDHVKDLQSFQLGWPPVYTNQPAETKLSMVDGTYKINISKGLDFTKLGDWDDPIGRATSLNAGQTILYLTELLIGYMPEPDMEKLSKYLDISGATANELSKSIYEESPQKFLSTFMNIISENSTDITKWLWDEATTPGPYEFMEAGAGLFQKLSLVMDLLGYSKVQGPFVWDMIMSPSEVSYDVTQSGGVITLQGSNEPPEAEFTFDPPAGVIGTNFQFNASATTDDIDDLSVLSFRWDFEGTGNFTAWANDPIANHMYSESGAYNVVMEAKDLSGQVGVSIHKVNVGGGAGTAKHIKIFRDRMPWNSSALDEVLASYGFTEGTGDYQYEIIPSAEMATASIYPGQDLVIIANDQTQDFYDNYAFNQIKFNNFVYTGGSMFWEACDKGWGYGVMADAGIILPGNIQTVYHYDNYNYVTNQSLPLVDGLPEEMDHNYASHESFANLPDGTTIYCVDSQTNPTLIEYNIGGGWVIVTGQPLEHQYDRVYGNNDMEELLPRIIQYFTGVHVEPIIKKPAMKSDKPSGL